MERKIIKVGNSLGIIIPSTLLEELNVTYQDSVHINYNRDLNMITISDKETTINNSLEELVKSMVNEYLKEKGL